MIIRTTRSYIHQFFASMQQDGDHQPQKGPYKMQLRNQHVTTFWQTAFMAPKCWDPDALQTVYRNGIWRMDYYYSKERSMSLMIPLFIDASSNCIMTLSPQDIPDNGRPTNWCSRTTGGRECPYLSKIMWMAVLLAKPQRTIHT